MTETYHLSRMHGIRTLAPAIVLLACAFTAGTMGCGQRGATQGTTTRGASSEQSEPRSPGLTRPELACRLHSCAPPYYCNQDKGICERLPCAESRDCPYGYKCDFSHHVCE